MTTAHLVAHLLYLFAHNMTDRHIWLSYFRRELPGMPRGWYAHYVTGLIHRYPWQMRRIILGRPSNL